MVTLYLSVFYSLFLLLNLLLKRMSKILIKSVTYNMKDLVSFVLIKTGF